MSLTDIITGRVYKQLFAAAAAEVREELGEEPSDAQPGQDLPVNRLREYFRDLDADNETR